MNKWEKAISFVLEMEGDYSNDPNDPGGETKFGISKKSFPEMNIKDLTVEEAKVIYRKRYWDPCHCTELKESYAIALFDSAVNQGVQTAIKILQGSLNLVTDGVVGPATIQTVNDSSHRDFKKYLAQRLVSYTRLIMQNPNLGIYANNWFFRVLSLFELTIKNEHQI